MSRGLVETQEAERRRLGAELHDELGPWLTALQADAEVLKQLTDSSRGDLAASARGVIEGAQQIHAVIRRVLNNLRPVLLSGSNLSDSIRGLVHHTAHVSAAPAIKLSLGEGVGTIGPPVDISAYRIVQESLWNVVRHAAARNVEVRLSIRERANGGAMLCITVADDGVGVDFSEPVRGYGVDGMRDRVRALGGTMRISRSRQGGVQVSARLPLDNAPTAP